MIKAVIFDCFGVLAQDAWFAFVNEHLKSSKDNEQAQASLRRVGAGLMSYEEFYEETAVLSSLSARQVKEKLTANPPDVKLFEFIEKILKPRYKVGMLSNAGADRTVALFGEKRAALFDDIVLSYQFGMVKPEAAIYELAAKRLGVVPEECIFIDDQERYCNAAELVGMEVIVHSDAESTIGIVEFLIQHA